MSAANDARNARERRIVAGLIAHMLRAGWSPYSNDDGGEHVYCPTLARAMATVFSVDESRLHFAPSALVEEVEETFDPTFIREEAKAQRRRARRACDAACNAVLLICGNDEDIISDWSYREGDAGGFNAAMTAFTDQHPFEQLLTDCTVELAVALRAMLAEFSRAETELDPETSGHKVALAAYAALRKAGL